MLRIVGRGLAVDAGQLERLVDHFRGRCGLGLGGGGGALERRDDHLC